MNITPDKSGNAPWLPLIAVALALSLLVAPMAAGQMDELENHLQALTAEREALTRELEQYKTTLSLINRSGKPAEQSTDPVVNRLATEIVDLKKRVIGVTEREVAALQELISVAAEAAQATPAVIDKGQDTPAHSVDKNYSLEKEEEQVRRLLALLASYYAELEVAALTMPSKLELQQREAARRAAERLDDAGKLAASSFPPGKVHLNGAEGSIALTRITRRLTNPDIPESRRDMAPICAIKTRLFGTLIASESRSLRPVGKRHFVARVRLQPGETTLRIKEKSWEIEVPEDANTREFLVTLYNPPNSSPELHLFAVADLLAADNSHIPAWLPDELKLPSGAG